MALIDRLAFDNPGPGGAENIASHTFAAGAWFIHQGLKTVAEIKTMFNMSTEDEVQMDLLVAHYQGLSASDKELFPELLERTLIFLSNGLITKSEAKSLMGM